MRNGEVATRLAHNQEIGGSSPSSATKLMSIRLPSGGGETPTVHGDSNVSSGRAHQTIISLKLSKEDH